MLRRLPILLTVLVLGLTPNRLPAAEERPEVTLVAGTPFGVGTIRVPATDGSVPEPPDVTYHVEGTDGRVYYPVYFRESLAEGSSSSKLSSRGAYFLFKGDQRLKIKFSDARRTVEQEAEVTASPEARKRLLANWWTHYKRAAKSNATMPIVENYTTHMLARRLGLEAPKVPSGQSWNQNELLGSFLGFEEVRLAMQADRMLNDGDQPEPADQPLPTATLPPAIDVPEVAEVEIEPLASRVPEECFYLRLGSYGNYRWFRDTVNTWGGDLREIIATRSVDYDIDGRLERQLVLKDSDFGKLLGETAISDLAIIGTDSFVREGASIGVLFKENQPGILAAAIEAQRLAARQRPDITDQTVDMEGKKVSLLTSPGNVVRSYYVADGGFHFVTTSSTLARRFIETGKGIRPLATLKEFRFARTKHGVAPGNPILAYLSDPFIRQLVSPAYRVEMTRRMKAEADVELVALARLAAIGEGAAHGSVDDLVAGGFLPPKFGKRADETIPLIVEGRVVDSLRGARRSFLPVADVLVPGVTRSEAQAYERFAQAYQALYRRMDPISIRLTREPVGQDRERIVAELSITPFTRQNLGSLANWLPPASHQQVATRPDVLAFLEAGAQSRVFAGVLDSDVSWRMDDGRIDLPPTFQSRPPLFIGEHGRGYRHLLDLKAEKGDDGYFSRPPAPGSNPEQNFGLQYGREWGDWWVVGLDPEVVRRATPGLSVVTSPRPAQLRLQIGNLGESKIGPLLRAQQYLQERTASGVNARVLDAFTEQLRVADQGARDAAAEVLGAGIVCPLGGEYRREPPDYQFSTHQPWYSSAWPAPRTRWRDTPFFERMALSDVHEPPAGYAPRLLNWFKGLGVEVMFDNQTMLSRVELLVAPAP